MNPSDSRLPVEPIQKAVLATGLPYCELARRLGWLRSNGYPDASKVKWAIGLKGGLTYKNGRIYGPYQAITISRMRATALIRAAGLDPVDVGL